MSYRTRFTSRCLRLVTFLAINILSAWLLFAMALDRLSLTLERAPPQE